MNGLTDGLFHEKCGMRNIRPTIAFLLIAFALSLACKSGDESPPEISPLAALLQINTLEDTTYDGSARLSVCHDDPLLSRCPALSAAETTMFQSIQDNLYVVLFLRNGAISGNLHLITPHFDSVPHDYRMDVTGSTGYAPDQTRTIDLQPVSNIATPGNTTLRLDFSRFSVSETPDTLTGTMTLGLRDTTNGTAVSADYAISLRKVQ